MLHRRELVATIVAKDGSCETAKGPKKCTPEALLIVLKALRGLGELVAEAGRHEWVGGARRRARVRRGEATDVVAHLDRVARASQLGPGRRAEHLGALGARGEGVEGARERLKSALLVLLQRIHRERLHMDLKMGRRRVGRGDRVGAGARGLEKEHRLGRRGGARVLAAGLLAVPMQQPRVRRGLVARTPTALLHLVERRHGERQAFGLVRARLAHRACERLDDRREHLPGEDAVRLRRLAHRLLHRQPGMLRAHVLHLTAPLVEPLQAGGVLLLELRELGEILEHVSVVRRRRSARRHAEAVRQAR